MSTLGSEQSKYLGFDKNPVNGIPLYHLLKCFTSLRKCLLDPSKCSLVNGAGLSFDWMVIPYGSAA